MKSSKILSRPPLATALNSCPAAGSVSYGRAQLWYWFKRGDDNPWYAAARVRRRAIGQSWPELVASIASDVAAAVSPREAAAVSAPRRPG